MPGANNKSKGGKLGGGGGGDDIVKTIMESFSDYQRENFQNELAHEASGVKIPIEGRSKKQLVSDLIDAGAEEVPYFLTREKAISREVARASLETLQESAQRWNLYGVKTNARVAATEQIISRLKSDILDKYGFYSPENAQRIRNNPKIKQKMDEVQTAWGRYVKSYRGAIPPSKVGEAAKFLDTQVRDVVKLLK